MNAHWTPRPLRTLAAALTVALAAAGCDETGTTAPEPLDGRADVAAPGPEIRVLTRNLYVGAPVEDLFTAPVGQIPIAAAEIWAAVQASDFPERAEALADEIARERPHLVGLQEVSVFKLQLVSDRALGGSTPATDVQLDFLAELLDALAARGLDYAPAATSTNFAAEVPIFNPAAPPLFPGGPTLSDIRLEDYDVVLARSDVAWTNPRNANFVARPVLELGGATLELPRGWAAVDATVHGRTFTFVDTHLEPAETADGLLNELQAGELAAAFAANPHPVILVGDLNSQADGGSTSTYGFLLDRGYEDAWTRGSDGFTCCHVDDLRNEQVDFTKRIDFVLVRGDPGYGPGGLRAVSKPTVVGDRIPDRTPSGLWPSDHAGVAVAFRLPPRPF